MTTLVTGAAGFVGSVVAACLARHGHDVHAVVRPGTSLHRLPADAVTVHRVDLNDTAALGEVVAAVRPAAVVHAAAAGAHGPPGDGSALWRDTVEVTTSLLDALDRHLPGRVVHLGSSMEYAPSPLPLREDDPRPPASARGTAKAAAGRAVRQWAGDRGVESTDLRLFRVYGAHEPAGRLVPAILRALEGGPPVPLPARPVGRDWVHVDDVAAACVRALTAGVAVPLLNVGSGVSRPPEDVIDAFAAAAGRPVPVVPGAWHHRPIDVSHWCADLTRLRAAWGWTPQVDLAAGAHLTLRAHQASGVLA